MLTLFENYMIFSKLSIIRVVTMNGVSCVESLAPATKRPFIVRSEELLRNECGQLPRFIQNFQTTFSSTLPEFTNLLLKLIKYTKFM